MGGTEQAAENRRSGFGALPSTRTGRITGLVLVLAIVLIAVNTIWIMPYTESLGGSQAFQHTFNAIVGGSVVLAGLLGIVALFVRRDRSWVVWLAVIMLVAVVALMVPDVLAQE